MGSKFRFSQKITYFSQFNDKFLKLEVKEYLIHYFWNVNSLILCILLILFSTIFTSGIASDFLMNELEDCIIFPNWAAWILLNFYLKQKQRFSVWNFTENANFILFDGRIFSRYPEIKKFKISKDLTFQKVTKTHWENASFKSNFKYQEVVCFTGYSL